MWIFIHVDASPGHVLFGRAFIKNAMQSTLQVNNSRADLSSCSHTRIHGGGATTKLVAYATHSSRCWNILPLGQAQHETNNFYYSHSRGRTVSSSICWAKRAFIHPSGHPGIPASRIHHTKSSSQKPASAWNPSRNERIMVFVFENTFIWGRCQGLRGAAVGVAASVGVGVGIRMPFSLRLWQRQLTQIVSSSTPTGRMRDVAVKELRKRQQQKQQRQQQQPQPLANELR